MVCDLFDHRVQVFELSRNWVEYFRTKGSGVLEFDKPVFTTALNDGRIVVTDNGIFLYGSKKMNGRQVRQTAIITTTCCKRQKARKKLRR